MRTSIVALAAAVGLASSATAGSSHDRFTMAKRATSGQPTDPQILNYALTLERLEKNFYFQGLDKFRPEDFKAAGYSQKVFDRIQQIAIQEKAHVTFLAGALGDAAVGVCKYNFEAAFSSVKAFLATSQILESVGTAAYLGAAPDITDKAYLAAAGSVLTIEARHTSFLNEVRGQSGFPVAFETALNYDQVFSLAAPFIVPGSCELASKLPTAIAAFPALTIKTAVPRSGRTSAISFAETGAAEYFAAFLNGGTTTFVPVVKGADGVQRIRVPEALDGITYVVISTSKTELDNTNTVAGPGIMFL